MQYESLQEKRLKESNKKLYNKNKPFNKNDFNSHLKKYLGKLQEKKLKRHSKNRKRSLEQLQGFKQLKSTYTSRYYEAFKSANSMVRNF